MWVVVWWVCLPCEAKERHIVSANVVSSVEYQLGLCRCLSLSADPRVTQRLSKLVEAVCLLVVCNVCHLTLKRQAGVTLDFNENDQVSQVLLRSVTRDCD